MIKQEIIEKISKYFKLTRFEAEKIFDDIFSFIAQGVKDDNIADVANFGEFIIKYDIEKSSGEVSLNDEYYKRTVEFLASSGLEEDLNENIPGKIVTGSIFDIAVSQEKDEISGVPPKSSVEDELRSKREALLSKISIHPLQDAEEERKKHEKESEVVVPPPPPVGETLEAEPDIPAQEIEEGTGELISQGEPRGPGAEAQTPFPDEIEPSGFEEDISKKSFSDYFAEVKEAGATEEISRAPAKFTERESAGAGVLPKTAIDLHNEITGAEKETMVSEPPAPPTEKLYEDKSGGAGSDKSYYIWYKDSESTPAETQNLSYEYELLYQATKEAEYKSKLKIYVTTFILFFSIVLILLIFSPVIYKVFFTPIELQSIENLREDAGVNQSSFEQEAFRNPRQETTPQNLTPPSETTTKSETPPVTEQQSGQQEVQKPQQTQVTGEPKIEGVTKNLMGWTDEKFRVIYVKLDNGKYAIQESSWDSEAKANKRITLIDSYKISGLNGSIARVEVSGKGTWYRVRLGEFSTVQEARTKAEELRNKVKS